MFYETHTHNLGDTHEVVRQIIHQGAFNVILERIKSYSVNINASSSWLKGLGEAHLEWTADNTSCSIVVYHLFVNRRMVSYVKEMVYRNICYSLLFTSVRPKNTLYIFYIHLNLLKAIGIDLYFSCHFHE